MDEQDVALPALGHAVALWYVGQGSAADVVFAACDVLVSGADGPALRALAAVEISRAEIEVDHLLEPALLELGIPHHPRESAAAEEAALVAMAHRVLSQAISPRDLTAWAHLRFGHDRLAAAEHVASLDDDYDYRESNGYAFDEVDANVFAEARRIVSRDENAPWS